MSSPVETYAFDVVYLYFDCVMCMRMYRRACVYFY